jgi:hypothetical protein
MKGGSEKSGGRTIRIEQVSWVNEEGIQIHWKNGDKESVWVTPAQGMGIVIGRDIGISADRDLPTFHAEMVKIEALEDEAHALAEKEVILPPAIGEALLVLFSPKNRADAVMGDLEERFNEEVNAKGAKRARLLYWARVLRSVGPLLWVKIRHAGILAALFEIGRRWGGLS